MRTNSLSKTPILTSLFLIISLSVYGQKQIAPSMKIDGSRKAQLRGFDINKDFDASALFDTVYVMEKTSNYILLQVEPMDGPTVWRYRMVQDLATDTPAADSIWLSGTVADTCCIMLEGLQPASRYQIELRNAEEGATASVWYSMIEDTRCRGVSADQMKLIGLDHDYASIMCEKQASSYEWVLRRQGSATTRHIETETNSIEWSNLASNTTHECMVRYMCNGIWSDYSDMDVFTTKAYEAQSCEPLGSSDTYTSDVSANDVQLNCKVQGYQYTWGMRLSGEDDWTVHSTSESHYKWLNLKPGKNYEYKVKVECEEDVWSDWSGVHYFKTKDDHYGGGECSQPQSHHMSVKDLSYNSASTYCGVGGSKYHWKIKEVGTSFWQEHKSSHHYHTWTGLKPNTKYAYMVSVHCHSGYWTDWSDLWYFTTHNHYGSDCGTPKSHHMSVKDISYNSASTYCSVEGSEYHWKFKEVGSSVWKKHESSHHYHTWTGLKPNTKYAYMVKVKCHNGYWTDWSDLWHFTTHDHYGSDCHTPQSHHMSVKDVSYNSASTYCAVGGYEYHWKFKEVGTNIWKKHESSHNYHTWTGLKHNTKYAYMVKVKCHNGYWTDWSDLWYFTTHDHYGNDCHTPQSHHMSHGKVTHNSASTYCHVDGYEYHWQLKPYGGGINDWKDYSGTHNYHDWSGLHYGTKYIYKVKVKCHNGYWTDWSDVYHFTTNDHYDHCSTPGNHHVYSYNHTHNSATTHCGVSANQYHWAMRGPGDHDWTHHTSTHNYYDWNNLHHNTRYEYKVKVECQNGYWTHWSSVHYFTTHDHYYGNTCATPSGHDFSGYLQEYNLFRIYIYAPFKEFSSALRKSGETEWAEHSTIANNMAWGNLDPGTSYEYRVRITCPDGTKSAWSGIRSFWTGAGSGISAGRSSGVGNLISNRELINRKVGIYPNPTAGHFYFSELQGEKNELSVYNLHGQLVLTRRGVQSDVPIDISHLQNGFYQVVIREGDGSTAVEKLVVSQ